MITRDPRFGEELHTFLYRCLEDARRLRESVCAQFDGTVVIVTREMTPDDVANAWSAAVGASWKRRRR
jgi:hypothetical protein